jgi:FkbM family methyltransferase
VTTRWYADRSLTRNLPLRYKAYALYSRIAADKETRHVRGGSFLLRALRAVSSAAHLSTIVEIGGIDGLTVVADMADERILEVIHEIRGDNPEYEVLSTLLHEGDTFVDVGANFGTFSLLASRIVGPHGHVFAFEPQRSLCELIRRSLDLSDVNNCNVVCAACGANAESLSLIIPRNDSGRAGFFREFSGRYEHDSVRAEVTTLDSALRRNTPGHMVIKIDVEGSEADVLDGARETIQLRNPAMIIEMNPWSAKAAGTSTTALVQKLVDLGYVNFSIAGDPRTSVDPAVIPHDRQLNLVATR